MRASKLNESKDNLTKALNILENNKGFLKNKAYVLELSKIYGNLGIIAKKETNFDLANFYYSKELSLIDNLNNQFDHQYNLFVAQSHQKIYALYSGFNKAEYAYSNLIEAERLMRDIDKTRNGVSSNYVNTLNSLGLYYANKNDFKKADSIFVKAFKVLEDNGIKNKKEQLRLLAFTFWNSSQTETNRYNLNKSYGLKNALASFKKAEKIYLYLEVYEDVNIQLQLSQCLLGLGAVLQYSGKYKESEEAYKKSIAIKKQLVRQTPGFNNIKLADVYFSYATLLNEDLKKNDEAKGYAQKAIANYEPYLKIDPSLQHWINEAKKILN